MLRLERRDLVYDLRECHDVVRKPGRYISIDTGEREWNGSDC